MLKEITASGKNLDEAKENAYAALGAGPLDDVKIEIIDLGSRGFLGFMAKPTKVKATMEVPDAPEARPDRQRRERPATEGAAEGESSRARNNKPRQKRPQNNNRRRDNNRQRNDKPQEIEAVIPEETLKMEPKSVTKGEDMSFDFVSTLISDIGIEASAELYACEDGTRRITIVGKDASVLIGHHGDTLDALQYLANLASARKNINGERDKSRVTLDIEGYRAKREQTLRALARRMASKALRNKRSVMLEPMSAYERRIIHSEIQGIEGVSTSSVGTDNNRKIVIYLTDKKPQGIFEEEDEKRTPLKEEFAPDADDVTYSMGATKQSVVSDLGDNAETEILVKTHPADDHAQDYDEDDIK